MSDRILFSQFVIDAINNDKCGGSCFSGRIFSFLDRKDPKDNWILEVEQPTKNWWWQRKPERTVSLQRGFRSFVYGGSNVRLEAAETAALLLAYDAFRDREEKAREERKEALRWWP